jgi:hypothetical protein
MKKYLVLFVLGLFLLAGMAILLKSPLTLGFLTPGKDALTDVLQHSEDCRSTLGVEAGDDTYSFSCSHSADTGYTVSITRFDSEAAAHSQFETNRGDYPVLCFHGYDQYETSSTNPYNQYIVQEQLGWQAGQWVISIYASFDYGYFHFTAQGFSELVYTSGLKHDLFQAGTCP